MAWFSAVVFVAFVALALVLIDTLGLPLGAVAWLMAYGLFRFICRGLLAVIGDPF